MVVIVERKNYEYAKGNVGKIKAAVVDIGWYLTQTQYLSGAQNTGLKINDAMGGQEFLKNFLDDKNNINWFEAIEPRVAHLANIGTLRGSLQELCDAFSLFEKDSFLNRRDLCIEVCLLCDKLGTR